MKGERRKKKAVEFNQEKTDRLSSSPSVQRTIQKLKMNIAIETGVPRKAEAGSLPLSMNNVFRKVRFQFVECSGHVSGFLGGRRLQSRPRQAIFHLWS